MHPGRTTNSSNCLLNYEEYLSANMAKIDKSQSNVLLFPPDDVEVVHIEKKFSTVEQLRPEIEFVLFYLPLEISLLNFFKKQKS